MNEEPQEPRFNWLTVVSMIALAGLLVFTMPGILLDAENRNRRRQRTPILTAAALESAVNNFHTEYGVLPGIGSPIQTDGPDGVRFLNILLGLEGDSPQKQNPGYIKFLSVRDAKDGRNGLQHDGKGSRVKGLYDLWGNPFIVEVNVKNEDKLRFNHGSKMVELPGRLVAAYSLGKDGKPGTADDVVTWNQ